MADVFTKKKRSEIMSRIRGKNTEIEMRAFRLLRLAGVSFLTHYSKVPGRPDIAMPRKKIAIFIDSRFWHGWRYPLWKKKLSPSWREKIERNRRNDRRVTRVLRKMGWRVVRLWEHQLKRDPEGALRRIRTVLKG